MTRDLLVTGGTVLTMDAARPEAEALLIRDGAVAAVGSSEDIRGMCGPQAKVLRLDGRTVTPGFIDAHVHLLAMSIRRACQIDLGVARSRGEVLDLVAAAVAGKGTGEWILGTGWSEGRWPDQTPPTRADLDGVAPQHPVFISRVCQHMAVVNSRALETVPPESDPATVDIANGWLREGATHPFVEATRPDQEAVAAALEAGVERLLGMGITCAHELVDRYGLLQYARIMRERSLPIRIRLNPNYPAFNELFRRREALPERDGWFGLGALKLFADGSLGARNAALSVPYADEPGTSGDLGLQSEVLEARVRQAADRGLQVMTHAIGDLAIDVVLNAYVRAGVGSSDRARVEHVELPSARHLEIMKSRGIVASMQPNFLQWGGARGVYAMRLGIEREAAMNPLRTMLDMGIHLAFGSDGMPPGPLHGIHQAVCAPHASQRLAPLEALRAYTAGGAYAGFAEDRQGVLRPGFFADFVVLSENPLDHPDRIDRIRVEEVYTDGVCRYRAEECTQTS